MKLDRSFKLPPASGLYCLQAAAHSLTSCQNDTDFQRPLGFTSTAYQGPASQLIVTEGTDGPVPGNHFFPNNYQLNSEEIGCLLQVNFIEEDGQMIV